MPTTQEVAQATVVDIQKGAFDVYISRASRGYKESPFRNPFSIGPDGNREEVTSKFFEYWHAPEQANLRQQAVRELTGKKLGVLPGSCHGEIIAAYLNSKASE